MGAASSDYQLRVAKIIRQLKQNINAGKPLGYPFFREKKIDFYRIYFLVYADLDAILLITLSDKKTQQDTINKIKRELDHYNNLIRKKLTLS